MNILVISGVHGNEVSAVEVGMHLAEKFKKHSRVKVISWANHSGLLAGTREMQHSSTRDLNRSFEKPDENYIDILKIAIDNADFVIDIHNSPRCAHFALLDINKKEQYLSNLCGDAGIEYGSRYSNGGTIKDYVNCHEHGKDAITYEFPGMSTYNNSENISRAIIEVTNLINMLLDKPFGRLFDNHTLHRIEELYEENAGFIEVLSDVNSVVPSGGVIYRVRNKENEVISTKRNETDSLIKILTLGNSIIKKGTCTGMYIRID